MEREEVRMRSTRAASKAQEDKIAKKLQGKRQANSGATAFSKGDVKTGLFLIEAKTAMTEKASMSIKSDWIEKLKEEAFAMGKRFWALAFNFGESGYKPTENYYIINEATFIRLQEMLQREEEEQ